MTEIQEPAFSSPFSTHLPFIWVFLKGKLATKIVVLVPVICAHTLVENRQKFHKVEILGCWKHSAANKFIYSSGILNGS